ncbi:MAG: AmmeMemoRadiSam system radical SAM enzyme [Bacteroidales bacterium]|nr:AmmeMemoRadiSam system radical SAM enzyme [Bacteroidales bacterium]
MKEALYYEPGEEGSVYCTLCPHHCHIHNGKRGICRVRINHDGKLISENFAQVSSVHFDPVEKKPLYHFFPGKTIFSVGSVGCNMHCRFCQNWEISQHGTDEFTMLRSMAPEEVISLARQRDDNVGIAFTYNEPLVWIEYLMDIARLARERRLFTVMVTNGFVSPEPLQDLVPLIDAFSVDLKGFTEDFYSHYTGSHLAPVLENLKAIRKSGCHLEIVHLVVTGANDRIDHFTAMVHWIRDELGPETVLHISRYFPVYRMTAPPTSEVVMDEFYHIARQELSYVYMGNIRSNKGSNTVCPNCGEVLVWRMGYQTDASGLDHLGRCRKCMQRVLDERFISD